MLDAPPLPADAAAPLLTTERLSDRLAQLLTRRIDSGSLRPGDRIAFNGPFGQFALNPGTAEKVFIGGGAGMAPLRAMVISLLERGAGERIHFWYGARTLTDAPYVAEMQALAQRYSNFNWHLVLSDAGSTDTGHAHGLVHAAAWEGLAAAQVQV